MREINNRDSTKSQSQVESLCGFHFHVRVDLLTYYQSAQTYVNKYLLLLLCNNKVFFYAINKLKKDVEQTGIASGLFAWWIAWILPKGIKSKHFILRSNGTTVCLSHRLDDLKNWTTFHVIAQGNTFQWAGGNCIASLFCFICFYLRLKRLWGYLNEV